MTKYRASLKAAFLSLPFTLCLFTPGVAQTATDNDAFAPSSSGDWASSFIGFLFSDGSLPADSPFSGADLSAVAAALRHAMSLYSYGMLILAGLLLFYHVAAMVAETAHHGVVMGRRANQVWAPIRLVVAIFLLVPMGNGLSVGQHIVVKIASAGSNLASHAWHDIAGPLSGTFFSLVTPRGPDLSTFVVTSVEMELCRDIYEQARAAPSSDSFMRLIGDIGDLKKFPAAGLAPETWRYTNLLNAAVPMCGEYRFSGYRRRGFSAPLYADGAGHAADDIASFSHTEADATLTKARVVAGYMAPAFNGNELAPIPDTGADLSLMRQTLQQDINRYLQIVMTEQNEWSAKYLAQTDKAGWMTAAFLIPDLVRLQESYGELVDHMLPDAQAPVFIHRALTQQVMSDAMLEEPALHDLDRDTADAIARFYARLSGSNARMHGWLYNNQGGDDALASSTAFDLRDQVNATTDAATAFTFFSSMIDTAALNSGVWGAAPGTQDGGNPFAIAVPAHSYNPLTTLIEFGRRQFNLGAYLAGAASSVLSVPQILAPAFFAALLGGFFMIGGLMLVFLIPLLAFGRFLIAVLAWLIELVEAVIAMPLVAIAHITPVGAGLSGGAARKAYMLWISLAIRPLLSIFGLAAGMILFALGTFILCAALSPLSQLASPANGGILIMANAGLVLIYDVLAYILANSAFKPINHFPDQALRWLSAFVMTEAAQDQPQISAAVSASASSSPLVSLMQKMTGDFDKGAGSNAAPASTASATTNNPLLPAYHQKADAGFAKPESATKTAAAFATGSSATPAVSVTAPVPPDKKDKEKDRKKDTAVTDTPFIPIKDKSTRDE